MFVYSFPCSISLLCPCTFSSFGMKVIRHAGVDSRMIILDNQARQKMTLHFQLSLQCNTSYSCMPDWKWRVIVQTNHPTNLFLCLLYLIAYIDNRIKLLPTQLWATSILEIVGLFLTVTTISKLRYAGSFPLWACTHNSHDPLNHLVRRLQIKTPICGQTTTVLRKKGFTDMADSCMAINRSLKQKSSYCYRNTRQCFHYIFCFTLHLITHICRSMLPYYYYSFIGFLCGCCCF